MGAIFIIIVNKLLINCGRIFKNMIAKKNILDSKMFQKAFNRGKFLHSKNFIFKFIPNNLKYSRFGIAIGVKVSKKANIRNKLKRKISEAIRLNLSSLRNGIDCVIILKQGNINEIAKLKFKDIKNEILSISFN
ncbi:MAG: Ribonuclease P protein component [Parcubacteria group bacterium GW2011_GWA2_31_28]|nr:MAG: Ribonuclease P protein component [Parcubacteria group bacterium GW2011_GWA2_31_28]